MQRSMPAQPTAVVSQGVHLIPVRRWHPTGHQVSIWSSLLIAAGRRILHCRAGLEPVARAAGTRRFRSDMDPSHLHLGADGDADPGWSGNEGSDVARRAHVDPAVVPSRVRHFSSTTQPTLNCPTSR
jgi:hypothetical protein